MNDEYETYHLQWEGIAVQIEWTPAWTKPDIIVIGHFKLSTEDRKPLPMTNTGFRSEFVHPDLVAEMGGPVAYIRAWLEHEAQSPDWKRHVEQSKQLSLF